MRKMALPGTGIVWKGKKAGERSRILDMFYLSLKKIYLKHKFSKQTKAVQSLPPMAAILNSLLLYRKLPVLPAARQPDGCDSILPKASSDRRAGFLRLF